MIRVTEDDFSIDEVIAHTRKPSMGAVVLFLGTVRNMTKSQQVEKLEFEADIETAEQELNKIREEVIQRFGATDVSIIHRTGIIEVGQNIVIIAVGAGHRDEAFKGCRFAIEQLKKTVPIWKKEYLSDGSYWADNKEPQDEQDPVSMVDISEKGLSVRVAQAVGDVVLKPDTVEAVRLGQTKKGEVLAVSETAGIMAAKKTSDLIPLCHQIPLSSVNISFNFHPNRITATCEVAATYPTGVEMEALVGVTTALLSIWDMVKYLEKDENGQYPTAHLEGIRVTKKQKVEAT
ncbi:MAG: cyclic pyranopterin monophosphate synthase MoaC [Candidatus Thorarchaeota archaeon]